VLNLDPSKLLIIAVVAVILLGPDKLPQVARQVGAAWRTLNDFRHRMENEVRSSIPDLPSSTDIARLARSPTALLNHLSNMAPDGAEGAANEAANEAGDASTGDATSAERRGDESSPEAMIPTESANGSVHGSPNGSASGSPNGNAGGHQPTISVPPTSTPSLTPAPSRPSEVAAPVDPSLN
jgi:sec-independent protein translocase protein TatB